MGDVDVVGGVEVEHLGSEHAARGGEGALGGLDGGVCGRELDAGRAEREARFLELSMGFVDETRGRDGGRHIGTFAARLDGIFKTEVDWHGPGAAMVERLREIAEAFREGRRRG